MRKNYFAKKFVAYSMAFAVAFSTLTVSPVFVKEAKATPTPYKATWITETPTVSTVSEGSILIESMTSDNAAGTEITTSMFAKATGETASDVVIPTVLNKAGTITIDLNADGSVDGADKAATSTPMVIDGKNTTKLRVTNTADNTKTPADKTAIWYKLEAVEGDFLAGKDTITYKYNRLKLVNNTDLSHSASIDLTRDSKNCGIYVAVDPVAKTIISAFNVKENTGLEADFPKSTVYANLGSTAKLVVDAKNESLRNISYSWSKDGEKLSNTSAEIAFSNVTESDYGTYRCTVTDGVDTLNRSITLSKYDVNTVSTANSSKALSTFETYAAVLNGDMLDNNSAKFTTSLPTGDYRYIWTVYDVDQDKEIAAPLFETDKLDYSARNNSITVTERTKKFDDNTTGYCTVVTCYAVPASIYDTEGTIITDLAAIASAVGPTAKASAVDTLRDYEVNNLISDAEYVEVFNLIDKTNINNYSSKTLEVKLGQELSLTVDSVASANNKAVEYQWSTGDKGATYTIDTVDVQDLGVVTCKAVECKEAHAAGKNCQNDSDNCDFTLGAPVLKTYAFNLVYVSDLTASIADVSAKKGEKNVVISASANATLPISYTWTKPAGSTAINTTPTIKEKFTISEVGTNDLYTNVNKKVYICDVSDGIKTIKLTSKVTEVSTYNVYIDETATTKADTVGTPATNSKKYAGKKGENAILAPVVELANDDIANTLTYKWTKDSVNGEVVGTDKTFTVAYPSSQTDYCVTITDGITKYVLTYTLSQVDLSQTTINGVVVYGKQTSNVYTGKAINPLKVVAQIAGPIFVELKEDVDYTVELKENVNAGLALYSNVKLAGDAADRNPAFGAYTDPSGYFYITRADNKLEIADKTVTQGQSVQPETVTNLSKGALTYTYYADEACTTAIEGVPTKVGVYYVKATSVATANYNEATSNVAKIVVAPGKPKIGNTSRTASSITLNWAKTTGATAYRVYIKKNGKFTKVANTTGLKYTVTGLASATTYEFAVKAFVNGVASPVYSVRTTTTAPAKVSTPAVTAKGSGKVAVSYGKVTRATGYQVYMAKGNGSYKKVAQGKLTAITKSKLTKGATYKFKVRAYKTVGSNTYYGAFSSAKAVKVK